MMNANLPPTAICFLNLFRVAVTLTLAAFTCAAAEPQFSDVFIAGKDGFPAIRIPSLVVTKGGTLLAIAEGRAFAQADQANNKLILKRSTNLGKTWGPLQLIADDGTNCLNNPCTVVDQKSGRIIVMFQSYPANHRETDGTIKPGLEGPDIVRNYVITSIDDGATWSPMRDVTRTTKHAERVTTVASGPGIGIQLQRSAHHLGRILMPFNEGPFGRWNVLAVFSDDGGESWKCGKPAPGCCLTNASGKVVSLVNEVQMVELSDGSVMLNSRKWGGQAIRKLAISKDGGRTWSQIKEEPALRDNGCMASIFRYSFAGRGETNCLLFSNPDAAKRENGTLRASYDDGKTWPVKKVLWPGSFAYSVLARLPDGSTGCLFEADKTERTVFARFTLDWLMTATETSNSSSLFPEKDAFIGGEDGCKTYRIPAAVTTLQGSVLAFCEGRRLGAGDSGRIDLVLKRSADGGQTWGPQQIVWSDGTNTCGNPCPVTDRETGVIWLLTTWNRGDDPERRIIDQTSHDTRREFVTSSSDDGVTWSTPREITPDVKLTNWTWYATGPGAGIQLAQGPHKGRLVIPCDHVEAGTKKYFSHVIYSDDHGHTWHLGGSSPEDNVNECEVVELSDSRLMLNMRNCRNSVHVRQVCFSEDGGATWHDQHPDAALVEPGCQASIRRLRDEPGVILFSNPASTKRENLTIRVSRDKGQTWPYAREIHSGSSAYSCLVELPNHDIGCLYEADGYRRIVFTRMSLTALAAQPAAPHEPPAHPTQQNLN